MSSESVDRNLVLRATASRIPAAAQKISKTPRVSTAYQYDDFDNNHSLRVEFRRLINPGITRNNPAPKALAAIEVSTQLLCFYLK